MVRIRVLLTLMAGAVAAVLLGCGAKATTAPLRAPRTETTVVRTSTDVTATTATHTIARPTVRPRHASAIRNYGGGFRPSGGIPVYDACPSLPDVTPANGQIGSTATSSAAPALPASTAAELGFTHYRGPRYRFHGRIYLSDVNGSGRTWHTGDTTRVQANLYQFEVDRPDGEPAGFYHAGCSGP